MSSENNKKCVVCNLAIERDDFERPYEPNFDDGMLRVCQNCGCLYAIVDGDLKLVKIQFSPYNDKKEEGIMEFKTI
jgi:hypothetical protein